MKKSYAFFALGLVLVASPLAEAGFKWGQYPVTINLNSRYWYGDMGSARNSANSTDRLDCQVTGSIGSSYASCWANSASGQFASCYTYDANVIDAIKAVTGDSRVWIYYDANGQCTSVYTHADSGSAPKLP